MGILKWKTILKENTVVSTILISFGGYIIVIGTFLDIWPESIYPELTISMMNRLADVIAIVNLSALCLIILGWYWIRKGDIEKHRRAMLTSFGLIILFLMLYLTKVGGGGTKEFIGPALVRYVYLVMLSVHIGLSVAAVPLVVYQVITGITRSPSELLKLKYHRKVGRMGATSWIISLSLGVITYLLLNHIYEWKLIGT
jgi:putative membrane protein